jgi:nucleotide-binding universal stress UspA family protein
VTLKMATAQGVDDMSDQLHGPVVVGIDGSEEATRAALYGAWEADRRRVPLRIVCAHQLVPPWGPAVVIADDAWEHGWLREQLAKARSAVAERYPDLAVQTRAELGSTPSVLVDESQTASLVVMATRATAGLVGHLTGSFSAQVASHAECPVMVLRPIGEFSDDPTEFRGKPVVAGIDGSPESERALAFAVDQAIARESELQAVFAWDMFDIHDVEPLVDESYSLTDSAEKAERLVTEATSGWSGRYPDLKITSSAVHSADAVATLAEIGSRAGLIVVGSRGHGGFLGLRLGSTVDGLIRIADAPVAVVRGSYAERR